MCLTKPEVTQHEALVRRTTNICSFNTLTRKLFIFYSNAKSSSSWLRYFGKKLIAMGMNLAAEVAEAVACLTYTYYQNLCRPSSEQ